MIKKYSILLFILIYIGFNGYSQEEKEPLVIKKWTVKSLVFSQPYTFERSDALPSFFTGIGAKMNYEKISYRISFEHINYVKEVEVLSQKGFFRENTLRLGAEYKMRHNELINLNFFLDAGISKIYEEANMKIIDSNIDIYESYDGYGLGAIFGIGFDYYLKPNFSLSLETRLDLIHIYGDYHKENLIQKYTVNYVTTHGKFNLNLLGNFSINYHF
ncbi:MAG: hypothetical protein ACI95T_000922 [Flavobacteriales bacterium]